ncbi:MFS-type efflux pump ArsJ specific for 1-arseno-3-phosphoglycerate [uncultured Gammaproteobacteria bacterium]|uniref:organoarsenical effux MFS transporter ArsJ n=1 Tax=methanotrophic endosymbiont of Bathymodiolus puteoserpentis (Logatchev) TaxID=343235 RepID=UPI0013CA3ADF|nr:organoarsenical effux MFS transporter ArsJ [methanotrophic endosymbiont of Bathymodiolus puteoserpentis (Logatchev)]CAC9633454.1 MFS-type efflux pump ArsJ specific for 1-arseno-3-phosphoglycerate [uncultured Gammaproteobacteria bacterium]SHE21827.1 Permease of the major facilitator superfamily [methanotrophic endosymbiont of Bathymodiolus puteoserpentis (Logatchev)]
MNTPIRQYMVVTASYWVFTLTDGALRMLVILYFHQLGYSPFEVASLFLLYEFCGVITNLIGGWLAAHIGLNTSLHFGLALQIVALCMLLVEPSLLSVVYVMVAQAISGIAKDLNKMSAKSSIKLLAPNNAQGKLYQWVALLTGSKNTLKGIGFFLGATLLTLLGFRAAIAILAFCLIIALMVSFLLLQKDLGKTKYKPKFTDIFSKSSAVNQLSAARFFLFGARDIWFVIALPVYLQEHLYWDYTEVGTLLAAWVIGYGFVQSASPLITGIRRGKIPDGRTAMLWATLLAIMPLAIAGFLQQGWQADSVLIIGLLAFGAIFAVNSAVHSYLIIAYAKEDGVSLDVGFYYMANALGRLVGTLLSGWVYQSYGLISCLIVSAIFIMITSLLSIALPRHHAI